MSIGIIKIKRDVKKAPKKKGGLNANKPAVPKIAKAKKAAPGNTKVKVARKTKKGMVKKAKVLGKEGIKGAKKAKK